MRAFSRMRRVSRPANVWYTDPMPSPESLQEIADLLAEAPRRPYEDPWLVADEVRRAADRLLRAFDEEPEAVRSWTGSLPQPVRGAANPALITQLDELGRGEEIAS